MDRRTLLTAMMGACVAAGTVGALATSVSAAVPRAVPLRRDTEAAAADDMTGAGDGEAQVHQAQVFVVRRRPRRRWFWRCPWRRRRYY